MRNHQQCALTRHQLLLQPGNRRIIHMVRRLVQNQKVGRTHQHAGERYALALAAAQLAHPLLQVRQAQLRQHSLRLALQLPGILVIHLLLQVQQTLLRLRALRLTLCILHSQLIITQQHHQRRIALKNLLQHRRLGIKGRVLRQIFHHHAAGNRQLAVARLTVRQHTQKRTFACTVDADNAIFISLFYVKCNIFKQQSVAIAVRKIFCAQNHALYLLVSNISKTMHCLKFYHFLPAAASLQSVKKHLYTSAKL